MLQSARKDEMRGWFKTVKDQVTRDKVRRGLRGMVLLHRRICSKHTVLYLLLLLLRTFDSFQSAIRESMFSLQ